MKQWIGAGLVAVATITTGCASQQQMLATRAPQAQQVALKRGQFDMNCPAATATLLSSDFIQPAIQGPWVEGLQRMEYTVGIEGCGQRETYVVMCQQGTDSCFAAHPQGRFGGQ